MRITIYVCSNIETLASGYVSDSQFYEDSIKEAVSVACLEIDNLGWATSKPDSIFSSWNGGRYRQFARYKGGFIVSLKEIDAQQEQQLDLIGSKLCDALAAIGAQEDRDNRDNGKIFLVVDASGEYIAQRGGRTPASNEAMEYETREEAQQACERETDTVIAIDAQ